MFYRKIVEFSTKAIFTIGISKYYKKEKFLEIINYNNFTLKSSKCNLFNNIKFVYQISGYTFT